MIHALSEQLLLAVKMQKPFDSLVKDLERIDYQKFYQEISNDDLKKAFWINMYNAWFQILRKFDKIEKPFIYRKRRIAVAGQKVSLDDIEHGILRRYRFKYSFGYIQNIFERKVIKKWAVEKMDHRIHFALNCGARSCPPIAFYSPSKIEQQLKMAELSFLEDTTEVDHDKREIWVNRILVWYIGDFNGRNGIRKLVKSVLNENVSSYKIRFSRYSNEELLDNYR